MVALIMVTHLEGALSQARIDLYHFNNAFFHNAFYIIIINKFRTTYNMMTTWYILVL